MDNFIKEITPYRILTNLVPGVLYYYICKTYIGYSFGLNEDSSLLLLIFVCYFIGMIIGRIGSIIIGPILNKIFKPGKYKEFIKAESIDKKIEILNTEKNIYRANISLFICVILTNIIYEINQDIDFCKSNWLLYLICILLIALFSLSYGKQNNFINERINPKRKK